MEPYFWLALLIPFFTIFYQTAWKNLNHNQNPKFSWPFIGFLPQMGSLAHRKLASMATSFKSTRLMFISLGSMRLVVSSHPETAKQILSGNAFSDRPIKETTRLLMFDRAIGFAPSGKYWHHLRKIASNHMFSPKRILNMEGFRQGVVNNMMQEVCKEMKDRGLVELRGILHKGSLDNMLESVFGSSNFGCRGDELGLMVKEGYELIGEFNWVDYFTLGFLDLFGVKKRCYNLACKVRDLLNGIIEERRRIGDFRTRDDFLSVLLSLPQEDQLCDADMVAVLWEMVFRGVDNVAILLEWIMARMVLHQDIQAKAQQEIDMCVGPNRHVQDSDIANLQYLQAIVKEVLRLHPPGPLLSWARLAIHDVHLDKCFIPAGTTAMVNMWAIAHDPMIWPDPSTFKPERFMEAEFSIMGSDLRLAPFGSGRRACPGKALGLATVHKWLARMLQQFKWLPSQPIDLGECLKLSLEMKKPLQCYAIARSFKK
ncbi:Cytochrome P450 CYP2 subfamily [Handroanthus impetiginosus]|uniref:Cytochrome P450 CYP2 subfamily n=1 Tax=Handroanthus impetiginosus TaxID=429701 RepID=A0A2G9H904_9LAMI|nr:Cytochrome P450 CYP2 subfamily [Handroanthus impetiginosus]